MSRNVKTFGACAGMAAVLIALFLFDPSAYHLAPKCPVKLLTGLDCPGCGIQRAVHAALHGRLAEAAHYNFFLIYALPYLLAVCIETAWPAGHVKTRMQHIIEHKVMIWFYIASFGLWFVVRNLLHI